MVSLHTSKTSRRLQALALSGTLLAVSGVLAACTNTSTDTTTDTSTDTYASSDAMVDTASSAMSDTTGSAGTDMTSSVSSSSDGISQTTGDQVVAMTVENFKFTPNVIHVKQGQKLSINLTDTTGNHGFGVPDLGINVAINEGETKTVVIPTDKPGTYSFRCTVPCGPGHRDMTGQIIIDAA